jgi:uncharacterized protein (TIGR02271 family)
MARNNQNTAVAEAACVGVFQSREEADRAVSRLLRAGFTRDQIGVIARNAEGNTVSQSADDEGNAGSGAAIGAATGAGVAGLVSLGISFGMIPAIGPILAVGPLAAALISAAGGAAAAGLAGALVGWGVPEDEAEFYQSEVEAGRYLVTVKADERRDEACRILHEDGGYDFSTAGEARTTEGRTMKLHEEQLHARKESVPAGEVTLRKETKVEQKTIEVPVRKEEVVVERHKVHGTASSADLKPDEVIRVPVSEEKVRVEKTPVVTEEVNVGKRVVEGTEKVTGDVRKEDVKVVRKGDVKIDDTERRGRR